MNAAQTLPRVPTLPKLWNLQNWRMGQKLLAAFLTAVLAPLLVTSIIAVQTSRDALLAQGSASLIVHSTNTATDIDQYMISHREDIAAISKLSQLSVYLANPQDSAAMATALRELQAMAKKTDYESIAIMNSEGTIVLSTSESDIGSQLAFRPYFLEAMKGTDYVSDPSVSVVTNRPAIFFSSPIRDASGKIVGVVRSRLSLDGIWHFVEKDKDAAGPGTAGILLDENGIRLAHSLSLGNRDELQNTVLYRAIAPVPAAAAKAIVDEKRFGQATSETVQVVPLPEVANALVSPGVKTFETTADKSTERHFASIAALTVKPWRYVIMTPMSTFTGAADTLRLYFMIAAIIVATLTVAGVILMARSITRPIVHLTKVADRISLGDLTAKIEIDQKDEIGELAEAVSRMQTSLQGAINRLRARRTPLP